MKRAPLSTYRQSAHPTNKYPLPLPLPVLAEIFNKRQRAHWKCLIFLIIEVQTISPEELNMYLAEYINSFQLKDRED